MEKNENKPFLKKIHSMKLLLLTGFLGSGKTTLLKRLIEHFSEQKIAVMMNEFGDIDVANIYDFTFALSKYNIGDEVEVIYIRNDQTVKIKLMLSGR